MAIRYKNVLERLRKLGFTSTYLRRERLMSQSTMANIRHNKPISTESINIACILLNCQPNDIMEVYYDDDILQEARKEMMRANRISKSESVPEKENTDTDSGGNDS